MLMLMMILVWSVPFLMTHSDWLPVLVQLSLLGSDQLMTMVNVAEEPIAIPLHPMVISSYTDPYHKFVERWRGAIVVYGSIDISVGSSLVAHWHSLVQWSVVVACDGCEPDNWCIVR